jgi:hypothetical protein
LKRPPQPNLLQRIAEHVKSPGRFHPLLPISAAVSAAAEIPPMAARQARLMVEEKQPYGEACL